ncbi:MAG: PIN domain-containing protein [Endomicrobium sp.]|jgi:predicted nucleic acid-binding protein|nr:PIN domain-containing protein [Endomicrobium sp.]
MKDKIFLDNDIILDISIKREPFLTDSIKLLNLIEAGQYLGFTSSVVFTNTYYIQRKLKDAETTISFLKKLRLILNVLSVDDIVIQKALESGFDDFEDAVQYFTCIQNKIDYIITRNTQDYKKSTIPIYTPLEFLNLKIRDLRN